MRGSTKKEDPDLARARAFLERLIRSTGYDFQEVDEKLGFSRGWVSRVIHGNIHLGYHHILRILDAIGVDRHRFFSALHPAPAAIPDDLGVLIQAAIRASLRGRPDSDPQPE